MLQLHLHSPLNTWLQYIAQRQLQAETRNIRVFGFGATYIRDLTVYSETNSIQHVSTGCMGHWTGSSLIQMMVGHLNWCQIIAKWTLKNKFQWNWINKNSDSFQSGRHMWKYCLQNSSHIVLNLNVSSFNSLQPGDDIMVTQIWVSKGSCNGLVPWQYQSITRTPVALFTNMD